MQGLRDLIRQNACTLFTCSITVEVLVGATTDRKTGAVSGGSIEKHTVAAGDLLALDESMRKDSTTKQAEAVVYVPVPSGGLAFKPAPAQRVVDGDGGRWTVVKVLPASVSGCLVGVHLYLARIK